MNDLANIVDEGLADGGLEQTSWARAFMPALAEAGRELQSSGRLTDRRVGLLLPLGPETAALALTLSDAGARVSVHSGAGRTNDSVAAALASGGVRVYARSDADAAADELLLDRFIDERVEFLIDDGGRGIGRVHAEGRHALASLVGAVEATADGVRGLRSLEVEGALTVPCIALDGSRVSQRFDNVYGTGQAVVMSIVDVTNIQLQGKEIVVVGYGSVGRGVARCAHSLGAEVVVTEISPVKALEALYDGHRVARLDEVCSTGDLFITATGVGGSLTAGHVRLMKDGAILAVAGAGPREIDLGGDRPLAVGAEARRHVNRVAIDEDRSVFLLAQGLRASEAAAEGNPIQILDLGLAVRCRAVQHLAETAHALAAVVHDLPADIEEAATRSVLTSRGIGIDEPPEATPA